MKKLACFLILAWASWAQAGPIDPATLQIGPGNTLDPVQLADNGVVNVLQNSGGAGTIGLNWFLILGIPNTTTTSADILKVNGTSVGPLLSDKAGQADATLSAGQEAYAQLGLSGPGVDASNNFVNWSGADLKDDGITATSFGLFIFDVPALLAAKQTDQELFGNLPVGTFVIAYGVGADGKVYVTPFTEAGLITPFSTPPTSTPAPASATLALLGASGLGLFLRQRRTRALVV